MNQDKLLLEEEDVTGTKTQQDQISKGRDETVSDGNSIRTDANSSSSSSEYSNPGEKDRFTNYAGSLGDVGV